MPKDCLGHNFQIPRKVTSPKNNLNKILDNAQRNSEIRDLTENSKPDLLGLIKLK